ncbi:helix-turn-helix transcriptional regulator [Phenylobacterium sp.]|uniref:helix-turn-helix transcriptional regulator n=1 Tax=Phenylobacterium sp. TaxID=1871053 RepID=UPI0035B2CCD7
MAANTLPDPAATLGGFLRDRRARLRPQPGAAGRRRTPGLRREEVAARAAVSVTWYTWLEQGRGGPPSDEVLERLSGALELDAAGREMLFLLGRRRQPPLVPAPTPKVDPVIQHVLDAMPDSPAFVKTPAWDTVAWNAAAVAVFGDYGALPDRERNGLRRLFCHPDVRTILQDWEEIARFAVAVFRIDVARVGGSPEADALAAELREISDDFRRFWAEAEVRSHGVGLKRYMHPAGGALNLEFSTFAVEGAEGLSMVVYTPATAADREIVRRLVAGRAEAA